MKNLLTYVSPDREFNDEHKMLARIQIDNSLRLGWKLDDILLVTNFPYEYNGVRSIVIGDDNYCIYHTAGTKVYVIVYMFQNNMIDDNVYWYHDFDCYQLAPFVDGDPDFGDADLGLTNYSRMPRLCSASMFFKNTAGDIFEDLKSTIDKHRMDEELGLARMLNRRWSLRDRVKLLNITYAFHRFNIRSCIKIVDKPIRAAHFHATSDKYDFYVRGNNKVQQVLIPDGLIDIFHQHGFAQ